ncbi:MAG: hypothetical protein BWX98_02421 [Candidatus Aminicenantes bacterium ADurb.Bin147]|nr:MAG: hypothetical protein BWX98_02421 [Candidatus Aminicenantes bacterium ADurb.Bin147]
MSLHEILEMGDQALDRSVDGVFSGQAVSGSGCLDAAENIPFGALERWGQADGGLGRRRPGGLDRLGRLDRGRFGGRPLPPERAKTLLDDPQALLHLGHPDEVSVVIIAPVAGRDFKFQAVVRQVRPGLPDVVGQARRAKGRPGPAVGHRLLAAHRRDVARPAEKDRIPVQKAADVPENAPGFLDSTADGGFVISLEVGPHAADPDVGRRQPGAGRLLDDVPEELTGLHIVKEGGEGPGFHGHGRQAGQVVADPRDLPHQHPDPLSPLGDPQPAELFHGQGVAEVVEKRRDVIQPVGVDQEIPPGPVLAGLFEAAVEIPHLDVGVLNPLAVELEHDPDRSMHGRVGRPHVDQQVLGAGGRNQRGGHGVSCFEFEGSG